MPTGVYPRSQAIRDNLSRLMMGTSRHLGYKHSDETKRAMSEKRKGRIPWNKGKTGFTHSEETKLKMSQSGKGRKRPPRSKEWALKISQAKTGTHQKPETIAKRSIALRGKRHTLETRKILSASRRGPNNPQWRGGTTSINSALRNSLEYKLWREAVFRRDNWTCVECGTRNSPFNADHIKPFCNFPELRFSLDNGRTLCVPCHKRTDTYGFNAVKA